MSLVTCDNHNTSEGETAIVTYDNYSRGSRVNCPMCELEEEKEKLEKELEDTKQLLEASNESIEELQLEIEELKEAAPETKEAV